MAETVTLKDQVRRKLRVTWSDPETDARIDTDIIPTADADLRFKIGIPDDATFDFSAPGTENKLFLAHCYYQWNDAEDEFEGNYAADLAHARRKWEVLQHAQEEAASADV